MRVEVMILIGYFVAMISIGLYWRKRTKSSEDYLLGGRSMGPFITALTLQTTAMSGYMFMGGPALAYSIGWFALFYAVGDAGGGIVNIAVLAKRMRRLSQILNTISPIEYLEKRYQSKKVEIIASIIAIFGLSGYILAQFLASGKTLSKLFDFPFAPALIIGVGVILFYTFVGGYFAVAWTDVVQGLIMVSAMVGILILSLVKVGGFTGLNTKLAALDPTYLSVWGKGLVYENAYGVIAGAVLIYLIGYMGLPHVVVKHMAMVSPTAAKSTLLYATVWNQLFIFSPYILGLCGILLLPNLQDKEMVIPNLAFDMFPGAIAAVVLTAIMSAIMSTVAALLMLIGTVLSVDIYKQWINPKATDKQILLTSRLMIITVGIVCIIIAIAKPPLIFGLVIFAFGSMACAFLPSYFCAVYWKKANATGAVWSMVLGAGVNILFTIIDSESRFAVHPFFAGIIVSSIAMYVGSHFGKPTDDHMKECLEKAKGTKIKISPKLEAANTSKLAPEAMAVSKFLKDVAPSSNKGTELS